MHNPSQFANKGNPSCVSECLSLRRAHFKCRRYGDKLQHKKWTITSTHYQLLSTLLKLLGNKLCWQRRWVQPPVNHLNLVLELWVCRCSRLNFMAKLLASKLSGASFPSLLWTYPTVRLGNSLHGFKHSKFGTETWCEFLDGLWVNSRVEWQIKGDRARVKRRRF